MMTKELLTILFSLSTEFSEERFGVVKNRARMSIVTVCENARVWNFVWEEVLDPANT